MIPAQVRLYYTRFFPTVALGLEPASVLAPWLDEHRLFSNCSSCGQRCLSKTTASGFSRGAVALSALEDDPGVDEIDVFGMNWAPDGGGHNDFVYPTIVRDCCSKCTVHPTPTARYGGSAGSGARRRWQRWTREAKNWGTVLAPLWLLLGALLWWWCARRGRRWRRVEEA